LRLALEVGGGALVDFECFDSDVVEYVPIVFAAAEIFGALAANHDHQVGYRAGVIFGVSIAFSETKAGQVFGFDVGDAVAGAADVRFVAVLGRSAGAGWLQQYQAQDGENET
jgi:hypothetical protein